VQVSDAWPDAKLSANLRRSYPRLLVGVIGLILVGNIFNLGADTGPLGADTQLLQPAKN
jgi:hypothetical protein